MNGRAVQFQVQIKKTHVIIMRNCFRFIGKHPILVAMLCLLFLMYIWTPLLFNLLLTASPVLVCTASLLGTLLMFGKPSIPEVEKDRADAEVSSDEISCKDERQMDSDVAEKQYELIHSVEDKGLSTEDENPPREIVDSLKVEHMDSSTHTYDDKKTNEEDSEENVGDEEDNDDADDSDQAESWSPDASMADIAPILDELHPLLELETPLPSHVSHDGSDASSERSNDKSDGSGDESDEEDQGEEEQDRDDENVDEDMDVDEECEAQEGKEDESEKVITWTEDDQKNLMDLGSLELERNQRLETLIARRRARKTLSMMPERNLIDFESTDLPFNVPSISTRRQNPFDMPNDSYEIFGLPPIPGSAPSFLATRRNPFDIPYDSNEEKPDLKGDGFEEFLTVPQKEIATFRRHESFSIGPSALGGIRRERIDARLRPVFVPEQMASEETSYGSFHRQLSEISESKGSSVPDTESVASVVEQEDKKLNEQEFFHEADDGSDNNLVGRSLHGSQSSEDVETIYDEQLGRELHHDEAEITLGFLNSQQEIEGHHFECQETATSIFHVDETHKRTEPSEENSSGSSSSSSSSLMSEGYKYVRGIGEEEESQNTDPRSDVSQDNRITKQSSSEESYYDDENRDTDEEEEEGSRSVNHRNYLMQDTSILKQSSFEESHFDHASMLVDDSRNAAAREERLTSVDLRGNHAQELSEQTSAEEFYFDDTSISKQLSHEESYFDGASELVDDKGSSGVLKEDGSSSVELRGDSFKENSISKQQSTEESNFDDASMLVDEKQIFEVNEEEGLITVDTRGDLAQETSTSKKISPEEAYISDASMVLDDSQHKDPVYDSSPQAVGRFLSFKSTSSDLQDEISEMSSTPNSLDLNIASSNRGSDESVEMGTPDKERMSSASSQLYTANGSPSSSTREAFDVPEHDDVDEVGQNLDDQNGSDIQKDACANNVSPDLTLIQSENESTKKAEMYIEEIQEHVGHDLDQVDLLELNAGSDVGVHLTAKEKSELAIDSFRKPSEDVNLPQPGEQEAELGHFLPNAVSSETMPKEKYERGKEEDDEQVHLSPSIQGDMVSGKNSNLNELDYVDSSDLGLQKDSDTKSAPELAVPVRDSSLSAPQEHHILLLGEQVSEIHLRALPEKMDDRGENSAIECDGLSSELDKVNESSPDDFLPPSQDEFHVSSSDIIVLSEGAEVHSSSSDGKNDADFCQNLNAGAGLISSGNQQVSSEEKALPDVETWDESMEMRSFNDQEKTELSPERGSLVKHKR